MAKSNPRYKRKFSYYKLLELDKNATQAEIKKAYHRAAHKYHPDKNNASAAQELFKRINEAYEILSNPLYRNDYDNSDTECPVCGTYEVKQTTENEWTCRHCGQKFDPSMETETIVNVERSAMSESQKSIVRLFQTTQCSWCKRFYSQPFLCPYDHLQSNCRSFSEISTQEREAAFSEGIWWWRMRDMIYSVQERGILAKCRECGALNPNPNMHELFCWKCHKNSLCCPGCAKSPILRYDIEKDIWKCPNASHGKIYKIQPKTQSKTRTVPLNHTQWKCPNCNCDIYFQIESEDFLCISCKHRYTYAELNGTSQKRTESRDQTGESNLQSDDEQNNKKTHKPVRLWQILAFLMFIILLVLIINRLISP
jgi:hypothetical protein